VSVAMPPLCPGPVAHKPRTGARCPAPFGETILVVDSLLLPIIITLSLLALGVGLYLVARRGRKAPPPLAKQEHIPGVGDDASEPRDTPRREIEDVAVSDVLVAEEPPTAVVPEQPTIEAPAPAAGRMARLRARLARSNTAIGAALLTLLSRDRIDESTWEEVEDTLLLADLGIGPTTELVDALRAEVRVRGIADPEQLRGVLTRQLLAQVDPTMERTLRTQRHDGKPAVVLIVGVNGTGKTTTTGKIARLLVAEDEHVVLGAADTFRAAAADQLATWGERVGAQVVRGPDGGDPAAVAFDAVRAGIESEADAVLVDTAGRLHTKTGLMDELGKVKRVIEKQAPVSEVLLVLDATTGQNGLNQARVFAEVVDITGIVLTKLDGTAKGGIVVAVQRELGVPVKLVGLGEGPDDLAPFDPEVFVSAIVSGS
jgi:fused signal recognition particle receptor